MARISFTHPYINVSQASVLKAGSTTEYQPDVKPGTKIRCDSGLYAYLKANGAVIEGGACVYKPSGLADYDATPVNTTVSAAIPSDIAVCVTSGGLADNQFGWFWLGEGEEYCYLTSAITSYTQLTTWTSAGHLAASGSGDNVADLIAIDSNTSSGLRLCRSVRLLATNFVCSTA